MKDKSKHVIMRFLSPGEKMIIFSNSTVFANGTWSCSLYRESYTADRHKFTKMQFRCELGTSGWEFLNYEETVDQSGEMMPSVLESLIVHR